MHDDCGDCAIHPHACGADVPVRARKHGTVAIHPPRMWGGCIGVDHAAALVPRFIPTYVGRMITLRSSSRTHSGSSPRTWGGCPYIDLYKGDRRRFIPTHVGRIASPASPSGFLPVHPHARGADVWFTRSAIVNTSVHPHARGADVCNRLLSLRILWVHPHARGADARRPESAARSAPVHPHARGADVGREAPFA